MAGLPIETAREVAMTEDLSRFWSTMSRKFDWDRPHHKAFSSALRSTSEATWENLVAQDNKPVVTSTPYSKEEARDGELGCSDFEDGYPALDLLDCEYRSEQVDWLSYHEERGVRKRASVHDEEETIVDGRDIDDVPVCYTIKGLQSHEFPVVGTYVHPSVVTGFHYTIRPADSKKYLFQGEALRLVSIGKGYGKRLTFASDTHNENDNYFWSDTHPEGYGFAVKLVQDDDKFILKDANNTPVATAEVAKLMGTQKEVTQRVLQNGSVEKRAQVSMICKVQYFHLSHADPKLLFISGIAVSNKPKGARSVASLQKITKCSIGGERGFTLIAGADTSKITKVVDGKKLGDIPIQYSISGLLPHELPVVGTYVDPRILTGFRYRVRPVDSKKSMFGGAALTLQSIGRGYGKRLTFTSDSLNNNENYFWSDTNPEGYGFSIQAVSPGETFRIINSSGVELGQAQVFRADAPQVEESTEVSSDGKVTKRVRITITCDISFHGEDDHTLIVTGTAVVVRTGRKAVVQRIEDVAVGSQMNLVFNQSSETLTFLRE